jgi:hypothetical protein
LESAVTTSETTLDEYKRMFAEARDLLADNRKEQQIDDDYYHGYQLTADERATLQKRKQPDTVFNRYRKSVNGTLGVLDGGATDPRAYGRNPGVDEDAADVVSKTLRYVADMNDFQELRLECAYDYLVPGTCAAIVEVDENNRPTARQIRWEEHFHDPRARKKDFSDARYQGIAKWMYADEVKALYPKQAKDIEDALQASAPIALSDTFEDRPRDSLSNWIDARRRRLMVVEIYHRDGDWMRCVFHAGGILEAGPSPYLDEKKKPECAIVAQSCYVDRENNRMGVGRDLRSPQDEFNKRRSKLLHLLNNRQVQAMPNEMGQMALSADVDLVRTEAAKPDGVLPPGWTTVPLTDMTAGQFNLLTLAETELDRQGPNPAILARGASPSASGRSKQVDQQAGMTEDAVVYKGIHNWEIRMYRAMWARCKQFWKAPDYIRVTDDQGAPKFIGINQPQEGMQLVAGPDGMPQMQPAVLGYDNKLEELDVDIILDVVPDTAALADEQFQALTELAKLYGPQEVPFDDLLDVSAIPNKSKLIEKRKQRAQEQQQAPPPPNPEAIKAQAQQQTEQMRAQVKLQTEQDRTQAKIQTDQQQMATNAQLEWAKAVLASRTQIEAAEISANTTLTTAQISAASQPSPQE